MKGMKMTGMAGVADFSNPNYETRKNYNNNNIVILANSIATLLVQSCNACLTVCYVSSGHPWDLIATGFCRIFATRMSEIVTMLYISGWLSLGHRQIGNPVPLIPFSVGHIVTLS